ncbi:hypothetical protein EV652_120118 [Kribbella steppae]|uniref:Uncharacterized protein n=1 Tax=Kribbella steppae TaxID=2512223 RepID=A0A4R2H1F8_9ACTN|nr:hypothetical protein [Kribbella steppae]TCO16624.1 hypothetical protein EV652_120118 [Kribbella steppae]
MTVDYRAQTAALADAYRKTMLEGDTQLHGRGERAILQALVASSAESAAHWVRTRVGDGGDVAKPLDDLVPDLQKGNRVGQGLKAVRSALLKQAKDLVFWTFLGGTKPILIGAAVSFVVGAFGFALDAGASVGAVLIPALVGGGAVIGALVRGLQQAPAVVNSIGTAAGSLYNSAESVGASAERIFREHSLPAVTALYGDAGPAGRTPVVGQLRGLAKTVVGIAYGLLTGCALVFVFGLASAWDAYSTPEQLPSTCIPAPPVITCPGR